MPSAWKPWAARRRNWAIPTSAVVRRRPRAVYMARLAPAGMVFIPCKDGISHNEIEDAQPEHITAGCNVLLHAMLERAGT